MDSQTVSITFGGGVHLKFKTIEVATLSGPPVVAAPILRVLSHMSCMDFQLHVCLFDVYTSHEILCKPKQSLLSRKSCQIEGVLFMNIAKPSFRRSLCIVHERRL